MDLDSLPILRKKQILHAKYKEFIIDIQKVKVLPKTVINELTARNFSLLSISFLKIFVNADKSTIKALFERNSDKLKFESVLMRYKDGRNSVCLSCMVGCPLNCSFCATGKMGFRANLSYDEITDQVIFWNNYLKAENQVVTNIVYMGMGEPLLNIENVLKSVELISSKDYLGMSQKRITISTSGIVKGIIELSKSNYNGELAVSLHSTDQLKREKIMPVAKLNKLIDLEIALKDYVSIKRNRITFEYILIKGINDGQEDAVNLANFVSKFDHIVNLIPYNKISGSEFERPSNNSIFKFKRLFDSNGINNTLRITMGDDTSSACGQLTTENG